MTQFPELELLYHIPNEGKRSLGAGARLKAMGLKSGVPDLCLPTAHGGYVGLYIEMKIKPNRPTEKQKKWLRALRAAGHMVAVCYDWNSAKQLLEYYMKLPLTRNTKGGQHEVTETMGVAESI